MGKPNSDWRVAAVRWIPLACVAIVGLLVWRGDAELIKEFFEATDHLLTLLLGGGIGMGAYHLGGRKQDGEEVG